MKNNLIVAKQRIETKTIFIAWLLLLIIPIFTIYYSLITFINFSYNEKIVELKPKLNLEAEKFKIDSMPSSYLFKKFQKFDKAFGFNNYKNKIINIKKYKEYKAQTILKQIESFIGIKAACVFYYGPDTNKISFAQGSILNQVKIRKPPRIFLQRLFGLANNQANNKIVESDTIQKKLQQYLKKTPKDKAENDIQLFFRAVFGNTTLVNITDKTIIRMLSSKLGTTGTTYLYYSKATNTCSGEKANLGGYFAIIRLQDIDPKAIIREATKSLFYKDFHRKLVYAHNKLSSPENFKPLEIYEFHKGENSLFLDVPIPQEYLIFLAQKGMLQIKELESLINKFPLLRVEVNNKNIYPSINQYLKQIKTIFLLIILIGTAIFLRLALFGLSFPISIKSKITFGISIVLLLPIFTLIFSSTIYNSFSHTTTKSSLKHYLVNRLLNLKIQVRNYLIEHEIRNFKLSENLRKEINRPDIELEKYLQNWLKDSGAKEAYLFKIDGSQILVKNKKRTQKKENSKVETNSIILYGKLVMGDLQVADKKRRDYKKSAIKEYSGRGSSGQISLPHLGELLTIDKLEPDARFANNIIYDNNNKVSAFLVIRYSSQMLLMNFFSQPIIKKQLTEIWRQYKIQFNFSIKESRSQKHTIHLHNLSEIEKTQLDLSQKIRKRFFWEKENTIEYIEPVDTLNYVGFAKATLNKNLKTNLSSNLIHKVFIYLIMLFIFVILLAQLFYVRPTSIISNQLLQISNGNFKYQCQLKTGDEFENLAISFNEMAKDIAQKEKLQKFVSKDAMNEITKVGSAELKSGGDLIIASILFCEITNFDDFSQNNPANNVIELLNQFVGIAAKVCEEHSGVIDKIVEGSLLITFKSGYHALNAAKTAMEISLTMQTLTSGKFNCHSGISTGKLISGKIGSTTGKLDFTVIGDTVNLAARLKSMFKLGESTQILLSESAKNNISTQTNTRKIGNMKIKGKQTKQPIYELIDFI